MFRFFKRRFGRTQHGKGLVNSAGMEVEAGTTHVETQMPVSTDTLEIIRPSKETKRFECGHVGPKTFALDIYGMKSKDILNSAECSECRLKEAKKVFIRCVLCGSAIMPGEGVAAYHESSKGLRKDIGYKVGENFLGCLGVNCCPSGGFYAGSWNGKVFEPAFKDGATVAEQVMATGRPVYIGDTAKRR